MTLPGESSRLNVAGISSTGGGGGDGGSLRIALSVFGPFVEDGVHLLWRRRSIGNDFDTKPMDALRGDLVCFFGGYLGVNRVRKDRSFWKA